MQTPLSDLCSEMLSSENLDDMPADLVVETFDQPPPEQEQEALEIEPEPPRPTTAEKEDPMFNTFFKNQSTLRVHKVLEQPSL